MRRSAAKALVCVAAVAPAINAEAADALLLPYTCSTKAGQPSLKAAPQPIRHEIVGGLDTRAFTVCRTSDPADCQNMVAHRFKVRCGDRTFDWPAFAERIKVPGSGRSWIEQERFHLLFPPESPAGKSGEPERQRMFVLPAGFAPIEEIGATLVREPSPDTTAQTAPTLPPALGGGPGLTVGPAAVTATADDDARAWTTDVEHAKSDMEHAAGLISSLPGFAIGLVALLMTSLLVAVGWFNQGGRLSVAAPWIRRDFWAARMPQRTLRRVSGGTFGNGVAAAVAMLENADAAVSALGKAGPLRDTLSAELRTIRQRLADLDAAPGAEGAGQARTAASLRGVIRDLERVRRIADSAAASLVTRGRRAGASDPAKVPKTPAEAYDLLGVNPNVSEAALKKIVDGLRMSWHPDHASGEADRLLREERTKQINIAWDLISGKRAA